MERFHNPTQRRCHNCGKWTALIGKCNADCPNPICYCCVMTSGSSKCDDCTSNLSYFHKGPDTTMTQCYRCGQRCWKRMMQKCISCSIKCCLQCAYDCEFPDDRHCQRCYILLDINKRNMTVYNFMKRSTKMTRMKHNYWKNKSRQVFYY